MLRRLRHPVPLVAQGLCLAALLALAGCAEPEQAEGQAVAVDAPLPTPRQAGGAITDMPEAPGPGEVPLGGAPPPPPPPAELPVDAFGLPPLEQNPEAGLLAPGATAGVPAAPPAPSAPADPRDAMREYYAAINARDFARAQAAWSDGPGAGQTPAEFAAGFADAATIELTVGEPRPVEGAADSVQVEVPVTVTTTRTDGSVQHQAGRYTLRRAQADGAGAAQRAWRIVAIDLRDAVRQAP